MEILVTSKKMFGTMQLYPLCGQSQLLAKLINKKTFNLMDIDLIKQLGYVVYFSDDQVEMELL